MYTGVSVRLDGSEERVFRVDGFVRGRRGCEWEWADLMRVLIYKGNRIFSVF